MKGRMIAFGLLCATIAGGWYAWDAGWIGSQGTKWLENRAWIDHYPTSKRDMVRYVIPMKVKKKQFGVFQSASHYRFGGERFLWRLSKNKMNLFFQQSKRKTAVKVRTWACKGEAPSPFELCMELSRGKDKAMYYSKKAWTVPRSDSLDASLPALMVPTPPKVTGCPDCEEGEVPWLGEYISE